MTKSLLVAGSVAFDSIESRAGKRDEILGGSATYICMAAGLFCGSNLVGIVGDGDFPEKHQDVLKSRGTNLDGLEFAPGRTFRWAGKYAHDFSSRETLDTQLGVFEQFDPKVPASCTKPDVVLLGNIGPAVQLKVLDQINAGYVVTDTMNLWIDIALDDLKSVMERTDLLVINDEEAMQLSGEMQIKKAAARILTMGPAAIIIKRGEHGAFLFTSVDMFYTPSIPLDDVVDPTGAGDSFVGALCGYLCANEGNTVLISDVKKAMHYATAVASATCEGFGTEKIMAIDKAELDRRLAALQQMIRPA